MTRKTRRIIFYIFLGIFIVIVPTIILYAMGFTFDFQKQIFTSTGGIYIKSLPSGANIYIDGKLRGETNGFIKRLNPKIYNIKLTMENYHDWQKEFVVQPQLVTKANDVVLLPLNPKISLVATESQEYLSFVSQDKEEPYYILKNNLYRTTDKKLLIQNVANYVIYKDGLIYLDNVNGEIFELDLTTLKSAQMFDQVFPSLNKGKWILSNDNKKLLCQKDKSVEILWLDDVTNGSVTRKKGDLDDIDFDQLINNVIWYPKTNEHLIVSTDNSILFTELDNRSPRNTINFITAEKPQIKYDSNNKILYFLSQSKLYQTEL